VDKAVENMVTGCVPVVDVLWVVAAPAAGYDQVAEVKYLYNSRLYDFLEIPLVTGLDPAGSTPERRRCCV